MIRHLKFASFLPLQTPPTPHFPFFYLLPIHSSLWEDFWGYRHAWDNPESWFGNSVKFPIIMPWTKTYHDWMGPFTNFTISNSISFTSILSMGITILHRKHQRRWGFSNWITSKETHRNYLNNWAQHRL